MQENMNKKSQAAMEFLMTYGWAILVIIIVIAILFSLDIFNPSVPKNCISVSPITCYDIKLSSNKLIEITLGGSDTEIANLNKIKLNTPIIGECTPAINTIPVDDKAILNCQIQTTESLTARNRFDGGAEISYKLYGGTNLHTLVIKFSGTIE